tara:strand:+ start:121 stop:1128 length:1008 start_codon:yes stop_codon:yes gene_type:complete
LKKINQLENQILEVLKSIKLPEYVILYGSFSRGEGTFKLFNGIYYPYNDIDLIFIDNKIKKKDLELYKKKLKNTLKTDFIDIEIMTLKKIKSLRKSVFSYDLFTYGKVLNGNLNLKSFQFPNNKIPLKEIELLFKTRLWTLVGSISYNNRIDFLDKYLFHYQMTKCIFSIIDCIMISKRSYTGLYKDKINKAYNIYEFKDYQYLLEYAHKIKLNNFSFDENINHEKLYCTISNLFLNSFERGLSLYFNDNLNLEEIILKNYFKSLRAFVMKKIYRIFDKDLASEYNFILLQYYLVNLFSGNKEKKENIIGIAKKIGINSNDIEYIRLKTAELRLK